MAIYQGSNKIGYNVDVVYSTAPVGTIIAYGGANVPGGWLKCEGDEVSKIAYPDLYNIIGDTWGTASDTTKFKLPNAKGRVLQGADGNLGTYIAESLPNITGKFYHDTNVKNILEGAFSYTDGNALNLANSATSTSGYVTFDASKSNPIYSGEHVQQNGIAVTFIIKALKVSDKYSDTPKDIYSTDEVVTDKVWMGKPVYRKVVDCGALPDTTGKLVAHNISNISFITNIKGIGKQTNGDYLILPYLFYQNNSNISISIYANNTNIGIQTYSDRTDVTETYVILEYTKTTD